MTSCLLMQLACGDSTGPIGVFVSPGVGSSFRYLATFRDSLGHEVRSRERITTIVSETSQALFGRENVTRFSYINLPHILPLFASNEPNGDLSYYASGSPQYQQDLAWITIPMATKGYRISQSNRSPPYYHAYSYLGATSFTLGTKQFNAIRFEYSEGLLGSMDTLGVCTYDAQTGILLKAEQRGVSIEITEFDFQ